MTTYAAPTITSTGLTIPAYADMIAYLVQQAQNIYGPSIYLGIDAQDYQLMSIFASMLNDTNQLLQMVVNAFGPQGATGPLLDSIVKLNGLKRNPASPALMYSTAPVTLTGTAGTAINNGIVQDTSGYQWSIPTTTIGVAGTANVTATCTTAGAIAAPIGAINTIVTTTYGWTSVTNTAAATTGIPQEADSALKARQAISTAQSSLTLLEGTEGAITNVQGVTRSIVLENDLAPISGVETGTANPSTNISTGTDTTLQIAVDADVVSRTFHAVTLTLTGLTTGAAIATALQTAIQAIGGIYAAVTVTYTTIYTITSGTSGVGSYVRVIPGATNDVSAALGLGVANGATDSPGLPAHSITAVVDGTATALSVATAIWSNKGPGCLANGTTVESLTDSYGQVTPIGFYIPTYLNFDIVINVRPLKGYTTATTTAIQTAVTNFLNGMALGSPAVVLSSLWGAALSAQNFSAPTFSLLSLTAAIHGSTQGSTDIPLLFYEAAQGNSAYVTVNT